MKLLALESSGLVASAAIAEDDKLIAEYTTNTKLTHSQTLLPMVDEIVRRTETDLHTLDAIAVSAGPGSFTGLRIGAATAKGLCLALDKPIISVPTLDAMIFGCGPSDHLVLPIMDARRNQVYTSLDGVSMAIDMHELIEKLNKSFNKGFTAEQGSKDICIQAAAQQGTGCAVDQRFECRGVAFLGDGVPVYRDQIENELRVPHIYLPACLNRQRASAVAALAMTLRPMNADDFAPEYLRKSQAEREKEEAEKAAR